MKLPSHYYFVPSKQNIIMRLHGVVRGIHRDRRRIRHKTPASYKQYKHWVWILKKWKLERDYYLELIRGSGERGV